MSLALAHKRRVLAQGPAMAVAGAAAVGYSPAAALSSPANAQKHLKLMDDALAVDLSASARSTAANFDSSSSVMSCCPSTKNTCSGTAIPD